MQARARSVHVRDEGLLYGHVLPSISRRHQAFESAQSAEQARKFRSCFNIDNCTRLRRMVGRQRRPVFCGSRGRRFPRPRSVRRVELTSGRVNCQDPLESMHHRYRFTRSLSGLPVQRHARRGDPDREGRRLIVAMGEVRRQLSKRGRRLRQL